MRAPSHPGHGEACRPWQVVGFTAIPPSAASLSCAPLFFLAPLLLFSFFCEEGETAAEWRVFFFKHMHVSGITSSPFRLPGGNPKKGGNRVTLRARGGFRSIMPPPPSLPPPLVSSRLATESHLSDPLSPWRGPVYPSTSPSFPPFLCPPTNPAAREMHTGPQLSQPHSPTWEWAAAPADRWLSPTTLPGRDPRRPDPVCPRGEGRRTLVGETPCPALTPPVTRG